MLRLEKCSILLGNKRIDETGQEVVYTTFVIAGEEEHQ
jgi:hypothetical protein